MSHSASLVSSLKQQITDSITSVTAKKRMLNTIDELEQSLTADQHNFIDDLKEPLQVSVCGGGHGAHAFVATISGSLNPQFKVNWLSFHGGGKYIYT